MGGSLPLLFVLVCLAAPSCGPSRGDAFAPPGHTHFLVFMDLSSSAADADRERWAEAAANELTEFRCGDRLTLFPLHDNTEGSAPVFDAELPPVPDDAGYEVDLAGQEGLQLARRGFAAALRKVVGAGARARRTDILGAIECARHNVSGNRRTVVILLSDMLQATPLLNLETTRLEPATVGPTIARILRHYRWNSSTLGPAEVRIFTAGLGIGERPLNEPRILESFWSELFGAVGGRVTHFGPAAEVTIGGQP